MAAARLAAAVPRVKAVAVPGPRMASVVASRAAAPLATLSTASSPLLASASVARHAALLRAPVRALSSGGGKKPGQPESHPYLTGNHRYLPGFSVPAPRPLDQIIKLPLLEREHPHHIRDIWLDYHSDRKDCVADVYTPEEYNGIMDRARRFPMFVVPVRKGDGKFFMLVAQWQERHCMFAFLDDFKKNPYAAEPYLAVTLYDDFIKRKQLVLVRGDKSGHLTQLESLKVMSLIKKFYLEDDRWVRTFNETPDEFDWQRYLAECP
uniref:ATP synthase mitochondrial F1 complex assembly factor 1 n=1 Tax=Bicosoecida sp. CB-2014 TaxID=1486930 RepID=A0A7S1C6F8_9STRA|mmetsp:Transcript_15581/g.54108  ORF Transcript_15581/g.54108 Transcript_15581/m.54108 type:complete len:265 (+) Transcript_15581:2-796(+)